MHVPVLSPRRLTGVAAIAAAAALIPVAALAATVSAPAGAATARTPRCATAGLVVWMNTQGSGAAGSVFYTLKFTNLSGHACTLRGYPGVSAVSLGGRRRQPGCLGSARRARGQARPRRHRVRGAAIQRCGHQQQRAPALRRRYRGWPAGLPARPDRVQDRAVPADGVHAPRAGLHGRAAGTDRAATRSTALTATPSAD